MLAFRKIDEGACLLCGSLDALTGEHKFKASILRDEFKGGGMVLAGKDAPKFAQSSKSKSFHFDAKICQQCNSVKTQPADIAFDALHAEMKKRYGEGRSLTNFSHGPNSSFSRDISLDCFRYFSKLLCCLLADVNGPRPKALAAFALGETDRNPVFLKVSRDDEYREMLVKYDAKGFASHSGLTFIFDEKKERLKKSCLPYRLVELLMNSGCSSVGLRDKNCISCFRKQFALR